MVATGSSRKVWSLCPFAWEREVLELRLATMDPFVDVHVIVEGVLDYMGRPREPVFPTMDIPEEIRAKIRYSQTPMPHGTDPWAREGHLRRSLSQQLDGIAPHDIVILSDCDEIVSPTAMPSIEAALEHTGTVRLLMWMHLYHLGWRWVSQEAGFQIARAAEWRTIERDHDGDIQEWRLIGSDGVVSLPAVPLAGWHLAYMGGPDMIRHKLQSHAHPEMAIPEHDDPEFIADCIRTGHDLFKRTHRKCVAAEIHSAPPPILDRLEALGSWSVLIDGGVQ